MSAITLEFDNRLEDHLEAERVFYRSTFWWKGDKVAAVLLVVLGGLCFMSISRTWAFVFLPLAVLEWFNLLSLRPLAVRYTFARNPKFRERYRITFSDEGLHFLTASIDSRIAWTHYSKVLASKSVILLVYGVRMYTVIPVRAFSSPAEQAAFMELVRRHVS